MVKMCVEFLLYFKVCIVCFLSDVFLNSLTQGYLLFRDLGVHIDGYVAVIGHTIVVGATKVPPIAERSISNLHCVFCDSSNCTLLEMNKYDQWLITKILVVSFGESNSTLLII